MFLKKLGISLVGLAFVMGLAVTSAQAQRGKYYRVDNGRHLGWYKADRGRRARGRYIVYRAVPRYYVSYEQPRYYSSYPQRYTRYSPRYYTSRYQPQYIRRNYTRYSPARYYSYPQYRSYRPYRRSGVSVSFRFGF